MAPRLRRCLLVVVWIMASACTDGTSGMTSSGALTDISGSWSGTFASSNNPPQQIAVGLTQSGRRIEGTWRAEMVNWNGLATGDVNGSAFTGQLTFSGTVNDQTPCTGTANVTGVVNQTSILWSSATGVVGVCPGALPAGIQIDLHR